MSRSEHAGERPPRTVLAFASDDRGALPLRVAVYAAMREARPETPCRVYILSDGISEEHRRELLATAARFPKCELRIIDVSGLSAPSAFKTTQRWPLVAWSRIFLPELLPDESRVVYCDIDTLACRDLAELFAVDLRGKALGAVLEHYSHAGSHFNERLGIPPEALGYFNSGVLVMDLDRFRRLGLTERVVRYAADRREALTCPDQDALNGALCDEVTPLHPMWNWHDGLTRNILRSDPQKKLWRGAKPREAVEAALRPGILHYMGPHKPWRYNYRLEGPRYARALKESGAWEGPLPGRTWKKSLKNYAYRPLYALTWWKIRRLARRWRLL